MRAGLYFTPINWHLTEAEAGYIVEDCGAQAVVTSVAVAEVAAPHGVRQAAQASAPGPVSAVRQGL